MSDELPEGWRERTLSDLCTAFEYGSSQKSQPSGKVPVLRMGNIQEGEIDWSELVYSNDEAEIRKYALAPNTVLFNRTNSPELVGKTSIYRGERPAIFAGYLIRVLTGPELHPGFLNLALNARGFKDYCERVKTDGVSQSNINASKLAAYSLNWCPLAEQRRIVAKVEALLTRVNAARQRLAKAPAILKRFRQSVLAAACSGRLTADWREERGQSESIADDLPEKWHQRFLSELCTAFEYGSSQKSEKSGKVPVLRMGNIQDGKIDWSDLIYSNDDEEIAKYSLAPDTVLFNRTNSPELVGKTGIYRGERPAIFAGYLIRIRTGPELDPTFLNLCLNAPPFKEYCLDVRTDGVSQSNINARKLADYSIHWCPLSEQHEIVRRVEALFKLADAIEKRVAAATTRAEKLTQAILAKAFRGELVPTEAELARREGRDYEPASVLLERIRSERDRTANVTSTSKAKRTRK